MQAGMINCECTYFARPYVQVTFLNLLNLYIQSYYHTPLLPAHFLIVVLHTQAKQKSELKIQNGDYR